MIDDDTEHYEPQRVASPWTSPSRAEWGWAPGHPYSRTEIPGTAGVVVYPLLAMMLGFTALFVFWMLGVLR